MSGKKSYFRIAGKYVAIGAAVCVLAVLLNIFVGGLSFLRLDVSDGRLYTPSAQTRAVLSGLTSDISVYVVGSETTASVRIREIAEKFASVGKRVKFDYISEEAASYLTGGTPAVSDMIVSDGRYSVIIPSADTLSYRYTTDESGARVQDGILITAEQQLLSAVEEITGDCPMAYYLDGHGETAAESGLNKLILGSQYHYQTLYLAEVSALPEDCRLVYINVPAMDITDKERDLLISYLAGGGNIVLVTDSKTGMYENLARVAAFAGLKELPGVVVEGDTGHMYDRSYPYYLLADYAENGYGLENGAAVPVLMGLAHGIESIEAEGFETRPVIISSDKSFLKPGARTDGVITYAEGDAMGPFVLGAVAEGANGGKLLWVASAQCMSDKIDAMVSGSNYALLGKVIGDMHGELRSLTQIEGKPYDPEALSVSGVLPGVILICIAAALAAAGMIITAKRRSAKITERK